MSNDRTSELQRHLERFRAGDAAARNELLAGAATRLRRLTWFMLHKDFARLRAWQGTDEVLHDAILRLCRRLETYTPVSLAQFFAMAAQEIRRQLLDLVRHVFGPHGPGSHPVAPLEPDLEAQRVPHAPAGSSDPAELALWTEFHRQAEALPDDERIVFDLVWYHGLSQVEAGTVLALSARTVGTRWRRACLRISAALGGNLPGM
jgi:RNA polymerase sigma-70 factor (ECF subfamily)